MFERIKRRWREVRSKGAPARAPLAERGANTGTAASKVALLEAQELVKKYGAVLEHKKTVTVSDAALPASKQQIKDALVAVARHVKSSGVTPEALEPLRIGYASLADFVSAHDASSAITFEGLATAGAEKLDNAGLEELARRVSDLGESALEVRDRTDEEFVRLVAEFEQIGN